MGHARFSVRINQIKSKPATLIEGVLVFSVVEGVALCQRRAAESSCLRREIIWYWLPIYCSREPGQNGLFMARRTGVLQ